MQLHWKEAKKFSSLIYFTHSTAPFLEVSLTSGGSKCDSKIFLCCCVLFFFFLDKALITYRHVALI